MANNHVEVFQFGIVGAITPNATQYMVPGAGATQVTEPQCRAPRAGTIKNLYVQQRVASGLAGRTDIYTIRVSGVDTAVTCTLNNATQGADTVNTVAVAAGNRLSVSLVSNDAADTSADCFVTFEIEFSQ